MGAWLLSPWGLVVALVVLGLVVLGAATAALAGRARPLKRAMFRLQLRAEQAESLQVKALDLHERGEALQAGFEELAARAAAAQARRSGPAPDGEVFSSTDRT
jgi:uncharacterized protein (DUF3084 family)